MPEDLHRDAGFDHHAPTTQQVAEAHVAIRQRCRELHRYLTHVLPGGPEKTHALDKVRETMFWANHSIAVNQRVGSSNG